jgi:hypothetical protein
MEIYYLPKVLIGCRLILFALLDDDGGERFLSAIGDGVVDTVKGEPLFEFAAIDGVDAACWLSDASGLAHTPLAAFSPVKLLLLFKRCFIFSTVCCCEQRVILKTRSLITRRSSVRSFFEHAVVWIDSGVLIVFLSFEFISFRISLDILAVICPFDLWIF